MQTTLLGLGIALIVALTAALVGPIFVDWDRYRPAFEAEAARMVGLPVRIGGSIEVRILPTPSIGLRDVEVGSRAAPVFGAQGARAELSLGALMRGEWRAAVLTLDAPDVSLSLDASGRIAAHAGPPAVDLDRVSIDHIVVANGSIGFYDAASRTRIALDRLAFSGDVRSLAGQIRGDGTFAAGGQSYRYRLATGRPGDTGMRLRLALEPAERPLSLELDGNLTMEQGAPRYEGAVTLVRPAGAVLASGKTVANEPWRITAKAKGDARQVLFEQIEAQYGPEERTLRMTGSAALRLGESPQLDAVLSARQIDLDRALADASGTRQLPLGALRGLGGGLAGIGHVAIPLHLGFGIDLVTLSGATVQAVQGDIRSDGRAWTIENFEFRAPGYTQVALSGRLAGPQDAVEFSGPVSVESADPRALLTWFEGFERARRPIGSLRLRGDVTVGNGRVAVERIQASFDRKDFEGRLAYVFPRDKQPAKLDAAVTAAELDVDGTIAFVTSAFAGSSFVRPGEIVLAADIGRAIVADVEATAAKVDLRLDGSGLRIEKLSVGDFGGTAVDARGAIDIAASPPRGSLAVRLDARRLDGVLAFARRFAPAVAAALQPHASILAPARIEASLGIDPSAAPSGMRGLAKFALHGNLGALKLDVSGEGQGDLTAPEAVDVRMRAQLSSDEGTLLAALGLDRLVAPDTRTASVTVAANGRVGGDLRVDAAIAGAGLDARAAGTVRLFGEEPRGSLALSLTAVGLRGAAAPVSLRATLPVASGAWRLDDLEGKVGDAAFHGKLSLAFADDWLLDGRISATRLDVPAVVAAVLGARPGQGQAWSGQQFAGLPLPGVRGEVAFDAPRASLTPTLSVDKLQGVLSLAPGEASFADLSGVIAGGTVAGRADFRAGSGGLTASGRVVLTNADARQVLRSGTHTPITGKVSAQLAFEGAGSTPAALIGALRGKGTVTLENAQISALDPKAIDAALRAADRGTPVAAERITELVTRTMDNGALDLSWASAPIEVSTGRARLGRLVVPPHVGDLAINGSLDLVDQTLDARVTLFGGAAAEGAVARPEVSVLLKGPVTAPRKSVDASVLISWLTLRAVDREARKLEEEEREIARRARLNDAIRDLLEKPVPPAPAAVVPPSAAAPLRMPPPPGADRHAPRAGMVEQAPLPAIPR